MNKIIDRTGEERLNKFGSKMIIKKYRKSSDIDVYFPEYNCVVKHLAYKEFKLGKIKCPYEPKICNIGYIGEGKYGSKNNEHVYNVWIKMLNRCYDYKTQQKNPSYIGCVVCKEWFNFQNFAKWYEDNYYEVLNERMCVDKDILYKGNKIYSPDTCVIVPERINCLFTKSNRIRGKYPIGVSWKDANQKFQVQCSIMENNKKKYKYLGLCETIKEGFSIYKAFKENYIKDVANEYKEYIPTYLYNALINYKVEIND